jgi:hypothetical protein
MSMRFGVDRRVLSIVAALGLAACAAGLPVSSAQAEGACANEQLRAEQPYGLELPDCRAYEVVSPLDKDDNNIAANQVRSSASGDAVTYASNGSFAEPASSKAADRYIARRGPTGWSVRNITPPYRSFNGNLFVPFEELFFTPDLSKGLIRSEYFPLTSESPAGYINLYLADTGSGSYEAVTGPPPGLGPYVQVEGSTEPQSVGTSTDLSHVVFQEYGTDLAPEGSPAKTHEYEWTNGHLSMIDIAPEGTTLEAEDEAGINNGIPARGDVWHAVSSDGSRVFFTGGDATGRNGQREVTGQVYVREVNQARTIEVSTSQKTNGKGTDGTDENGPRPARYWGASVDGSRAFFTSRAELTNNAYTGPADNASNLYEYNLETGVLGDLTVDTNIGDVNGAEVLGLVTAGDDGSYVYFVAEGRLAEGAVLGQPNLYLSHAGKIAFIATLEHAETVGSNGAEGNGDSLDWAGAKPDSGEAAFESLGPGSHTVRVTPDGTHLAFESELSLTGYDNKPVEPNDCLGIVNFEFASRPCKEIYVYDTTTGLTCVSCDPNDSPPIGPATLGGKEETNELFGTPFPYYSPHNFSDDGGRLFFQSPDPLVPHDSNGRQDVYEYEGGHLYPISNVAGNYNSHFVDASSSGNDAFITTPDQLLPSDTDSRADAYDVRVNGGWPVSVSSPECDNGDSCKGPVSQQPGVFGAPASATFSGAGNVLPVSSAKPRVTAKTRAKRCGKGYVRKRGRCIKRKARKSVGLSTKGRK